MHLQIITIYCLCDEFLRAYAHTDDKQARMTSAEVMTTALVAAQFFTGNQELSRRFLQEHGYIPAMLSKSRFNRRLHALPEALWQAFLHLLGEVHQQMNPEGIFLVDSLPIPVCDNIRIQRCRLYQGEAFRAILPANAVTSTASRRIWWSPSRANPSRSCCVQEPTMT